jgi:hypothetical protein
MTLSDFESYDAAPRDAPPFSASSSPLKIYFVERSNVRGRVLPASLEARLFKSLAKMPAKLAEKSMSERAR